MKRTLLKQGTILLCFALCACSAPVEAPPSTAAPAATPAITTRPTPTPTAKTPQPTVIAPVLPIENTPSPEPTPLAAEDWQIELLPPHFKPSGVFSWRQIVEKSAFSLGDIHLAADGDERGPFTIERGTYPSIDGSTVAIPMAEEFASQHLRLDSSYSIVSFNTTHHAYENLILNQNNWSEHVAPPGVWLTDTATQKQSKYATVQVSGTDLFIGTGPSPDELQMAKDNGVELVMQPVCCDAFVFITYPGNPVQSLTIQQIRDIYTGKVTNWKELGGEDLPIKAYSRDINSGSQTAMEALVMQGTPTSPSIVSEDTIGDMSTLVEAVMSRGALGYTYKYYLFQEFGEGNSYNAAGTVDMLSINGIAPTSKNIANESYPFSVHYYGVIRKGDEKKPGGLFLDWMRSEEGQACIKQAGYIALDGSEASFYFDRDGFLFADSSRRLLTKADLEDLWEYTYYGGEQLKELLGFARNEIFARRGHTFQNVLYAGHYTQYDWYSALPKRTVTLEDLNTIEQANVRLIKKLEQDMQEWDRWVWEWD